MNQLLIESIDISTEPQFISIADYPQGVYIFEITEGESTIRKRFVKSK